MDALLDSHTVLWALYDPSKLPPTLREVLQDPTYGLFISEASLWELSDKAAKGRLPLAGSGLSFVDDIRALGAALLPIERGDILASVALPLHHGDPFDRLIVAQAKLRNLVLITKDADIAKYDVTVRWN